ncbi:hypothetical protein GALMADRAFT_1042023 [Galerina marginata CBS 339.88]|uniref:LIM zinc-binding domain-containing protein n=1 Tax=Galerina marginata (strain CBS 339.88) TaxID=685588 RepID=A0A067SKZ2_GALM3|nr:hypothetical protein GALMADRAFT_1042023 [Galerina marginata CBS 339.88]
MDTPNRNLNRTQTVLDLHRDPKNESLKDKLATVDTRLCPGCRKPAAGKKGGLVIACGESFFHVDCYNCKNCQSAIGIQDPILLDIDRLPLCEKCFHKCIACQLTIMDKILYVGRDSSPYHTECFKCKKCSKPLEGEKFAKSRQSIYCTDCHDKRVDKIKRHLEKKEERERNAYGGIASPPP